MYFWWFLGLSGTILIGTLLTKLVDHLSVRANRRLSAGHKIVPLVTDNIHRQHWIVLTSIVLMMCIGGISPVEPRFTVPMIINIIVLLIVLRYWIRQPKNTVTYHVIRPPQSPD